MTAAIDLLEYGQKLLAERQAKREAEQKAAEVRQLEEEAQLLEEARALAWAHLGAAFDELAVGKSHVYYGTAVIELCFGSGPTETTLEYRKVSNRLQIRRHLDRNHYVDLDLRQASQEDVAIFLAECQADYEAERRRAFDRARNEMRHPDPEWDRDPQKVYKFYVKKWPDLQDALTAELKVVQADLAQAEAERQAREKHQADMQACVWFPFALWRLVHVARTEDGDIHTQTSYSLAPEPDADGWWPVVGWKGVVTLTKYPALLRIEEVHVVTWGDEAAKGVCRRLKIEGAHVLAPPLGAVALDTVEDEVRDQMEREAQRAPAGDDDDEA